MENTTRRRPLRVALAALTVSLLAGGGLIGASAAYADSPIGVNGSGSYTCNNDGTVNGVFIEASFRFSDDAEAITVGVRRNGDPQPSANRTVLTNKDTYSSGKLNAAAGDTFDLWVQDVRNDASYTYTVPGNACAKPAPTPEPTPEPTKPPVPTPTPTLEPTPEPTATPTPDPTPTVQPTPSPAPTPSTSPTAPVEPPDVAPSIDSATFSSDCFNGKPGAKGAVNVNVPKGSDPVKVTVQEEKSGTVLFEETISKSGQVAGGDVLPEGYYKLIVLLNGNEAGSGYVIVKACEDTSTPSPSPTVSPEPTPTPGTPEPTPQPTEPTVPTPTPTSGAPGPTTPTEPSPTPTSPAPSPAPVLVPNNPTPPSPMTPPAQQPNTTNVPPLASTGDTVTTAGSNSMTPAAPVTPFALLGLLLVFIAMGIKVSSPKRRNRSSSIDGA
jgi:hypothetical protein